tara:strand:+ start:221 stop:2392 length:2172 start_codon:yes stop_codon:yes gene_type:complete
MELSHLLNDLNEAQRQAVAAPLVNQLILAGAGSGKTRVLTNRIAWLVEVEGFSPFSILAVTFTNKAAAEMRGRVEQLINMPTNGMWLGTFHSMAHRLLRMHHDEAGLPDNFQIIDSDDQQRIIKRTIKGMDLDSEKWPAKQAQWYINNKKDDGIRPDNIDADGDLYEETMKRIYASYHQACERGGLVDFAELLLRSHELWLNKPTILKHYQERFRYILVDEFQDTNRLQYAWVRMLVGDNTKLMIVGDDDQSIYGWRGARVENILNFEKDFPDCQTVRLEQNYRSTSTILEAANSVINCNDERLGKSLWTDSNKGELISVYAAFNDLDEARFIVARIKDWFTQGNRYDETAILYRSNAQSRVLEEALLQSNIPYRVYGGQRFFDRAEIKDALAYMRLVSNRHDDAAFERVVNTPTRGMGDRTLVTIRDLARADNTSMWRAAERIIDMHELPARANSAALNFLTLINSMDEATTDVELFEQTEHVIQNSGLVDHYRKERGEKAQMRLENLGELVTATKQFDPSMVEDIENLTPLQAFLSHAALEAGDQQAAKFQDCVQMMTLHTAKGLEFPLVFLAGVEEGLFPHQRSIEEPDRLEEERRLCYVGITRAMQKLYISHAEQRRLYGREVYPTPSRFIREIPDKLIEEVRLRNSSFSTPRQTRQSIRNDVITDTGKYKLGQQVTHAKFGHGVILNYEGQGEHARVQVQFDSGCKWLMVNYAKLEAV